VNLLARADLMYPSAQKLRRLRNVKHKARKSVDSGVSSAVNHKNVEQTGYVHGI